MFREPSAAVHTALLALAAFALSQKFRFPQPVGSFRSGRTKGNICRKLWRELLDQIVRGEPALQTCAVLYCVTACCAVYVACCMLRCCAELYAV